MSENKYGLTNRVRISNAIDKELYKQLKQISDETMIPISKLLDQAIKLLIEEHK
ncbi:ribbon-helix-helix domain-containing protein [Mammaliicoccus sciuri]|uniref:ribbon-helix-helix domain-containing protein n=1 Tax=Mammaliicoccus sciuri TaxID=1296 RepID=UPI001AEBEF67|nr:ribbon-helix-helix domain-containing protein [Mammaliicoccus sciuri]MEB5649007.1 ribbon-helix-helix domain-containing protein [Mammaliicoccus sciuri]